MDSSPLRVVVTNVESTQVKFETDDFEVFMTCLFSTYKWRHLIDACKNGTVSEIHQHDCEPSIFVANGTATFILNSGRGGCVRYKIPAKNCIEAFETVCRIGEFGRVRLVPHGETNVCRIAPERVRWWIMDEPSQEEQITTGTLKNLTGNDSYWALHQKGKDAKE